MPKQNPNEIKDQEKYDKLREEGMSKEKAARIANTEDSEEKEKED